MAGGGKLLLAGVAERGNQVGARRVGGRGWDKRGGARGERGWNLYSNKVFNKTGIVTLILVIGMHITRRNRPKSWGIPDFGGIPIVMTSRSRKYVIISPKKSPKMRRREISPLYLCKMEQPSWKNEKLAHFEFLNSNISVFGHDFKPKMEISTDFSVIRRWYKRLVIVFSGF